MKLAPVFERVAPPAVTQEVQAWLILAGLLGIICAPFIPLHIAVIVINEASMVALVTSGLAGLDSTRPNVGEES